MKKLLIVLFSYCVTQFSFAQKEANNWTIGDNITMDLNENPPKLLEKGLKGYSETEGESMATISDKEGNLLFYVGGPTLYNYDGTVVISDLKGHESSQQGSLIVQKPGSSTRYYIFTSVPFSNFGQNTNIHGIYYTEIEYDFQAKTITEIAKNTVITTEKYSMEALTMVPNANGTDLWLITHKAGGSDEYHIYPVTGNGVGTAVVSAIGQNIPLQTSPNLYPNEIGAIKSNSCYTQLALSNLGTGIIDVVDFDNATGKVSKLFTTINGFAVNDLYSIEFSSNGQYLYAIEYNSKKISQFDLTAGNVLASKALLGTGTTARLGQLQLAADGKIYFAQHQWSNGGFIGVINNPNVKGVNANANFEYIKAAPNFENQTVTMGLPNFPKQYVSSIPTLLVNDMPYSNQLNVCAGNPIQFNGMIDNQVSQNVSFKIAGVELKGNTHTFEKGGNYLIESTSTTACGNQKVATFSLKVNDIPSLVIDYKEPNMSRCENQDIILEASSSSPGVIDYAWYENQFGGQKLVEGNEFIHKGTLPKTVWVEPKGKLYAEIGHKVTLNRFGSATNAYTKFEILDPTILKSAQLNTYVNFGDCSETEINYEIRKDDPITGTVVFTNKEKVIGCQGHQLMINQEFQKGTYYLIFKEKTGIMNIDASAINSFYTKPYENEVISVQDGGGSTFSKKEGLFNNFITQEILPCTQRVSFTITENLFISKPKLVATNSFVCQGSQDEFMVEGAEQTATFTWTSPKGTNVVGTGSKISLSSTITGQTDTLRVTVMDNQVCGKNHKLKIPVTFITVPTTANLVIKGNTTICKGTKSLEYSAENAFFEPNQGFKWELNNGQNIVLQAQGGNKIITDELSKVLLTPNEGIKSVDLMVTPYNACGLGNVVIQKIEINNFSEKPSVALDTIRLCANENMFLTVENAPIYGTASWTKVTNGLGTIVSPKQVSTRILDLTHEDVFTAKWTVKNGVCPAESVNQTIAVKTQKECTITTLENETTSSLVAYPNPFTEEIILKNIPTIVEKIEVIDVFGNVVQTQTAISNTMVLGSTLSSGTYLIYLYSVDNVEIIKTVKMK